MKNQLPLILTAIVCTFIIAIGIMGNEKIKSNSYERQQKLKIATEQERLEDEKREELQRKTALSFCLQDAEDIYWSYIELNGTLTDKETGTYRASTYDWNKAQERKDAKSDICFKKYDK